jgi:hypothetical protein
MSHESLNPEDYYMRPSQEETLPQTENPGVTPEVNLLIENLPYILEVTESIKDIPAQMELSARCNLAARFVTMGEHGPVFFRSQFENCFAAIASYDPDATAEPPKAAQNASRT